MPRCRVTWSLFGFVLILSLSSTALGQAGTNGDVGYSVDAGQDAPATHTAPETSAPPPKLSITLEGYEKLDRPPSSPESPTAPAKTSPSPAAKPASPPGAAVPSPEAVSPSRPSPVLSMLESTLGGNYANTRAIARTMPGKYSFRVRDKALARKFSKQGNELLNKQDNPSAALDAYRMAYENDPSSSEITGSYGYTLFRNGRFAEARDMEIESLEIAPEYAAAWFVLGQIFGYLKQEDMAYASFVNTCLFTKNITTSLGFLEREMKKYGEVTVQQAAGRALEACRGLGPATGSSDGPSSRPAPSEPAPLLPGSGAAEAPAPGKAGARWSTVKIGKVDIQAAIMDSRLFQNIVAKMAKMPKSQHDAWLDSQLGPVIGELQGIIRNYAAQNNFLLVIQSKDEDKVRHGGSLRTVNGLVENEEFAAYLDSSEGRTRRNSWPIQDLTPIVASKLGAR